MKTIKKTTLIAAITAMAAIAVPSMASALTWAPLNANKTLTSVGASPYRLASDTIGAGFQCSSSTLGVHVRTPASSTLDITSASLTGCSLTQSTCGVTGPVTVTATGLPWTATWTPTYGYVSITQHLQVTNNPCWPGYTFTVDGPTNGTYFNTDHKLSAVPAYPTPGMNVYLMGTQVGTVGNNNITWFHETTNTLTLN